MPKRMPPTHAAAWSSPRSATGASPPRSPEGLISGRSARSRPNDRPATAERGAPKEARMNQLSPELTRQVLHPAMHQKLLLRAAELVELGWTRGTAARDVDGQKV